MFHGTDNSYIEFPHIRVNLGTQSSITLMCWVQREGQDGPIFSKYPFYRRVGMWIMNGKFFVQLVDLHSQPLTAENFPTAKWAHVAASYDHNTGNNSLYVNGHLRASRNIGSDKTPFSVRGYRMGSTDSRSDHFKGKIAEMKVYDAALNEAQIQTSIRQGSCTFPIIFVSLLSPMIPLIIEIPFYWKASQEVTDVHFWIRFRKTTSR